MSTFKLHYFDLPGRAEASRIIGAVGGLDVQDVNHNKESWAELKPKTPYGQLPVLELEDGRMLAQSQQIEQFLGKKAGLFPEGDDFEVAQALSVYNVLVDMWESFVATMSIKDQEAKVKARQDLLLPGNKARTQLDILSKVLASNGGFLHGGKLTFLDLCLFSLTGQLSSGWLDGVPTDMLDSFPELKAHHNRIASLPAVKARYESADGIRKAYQPLA